MGIAKHIIFASLTAAAVTIGCEDNRNTNRPGTPSTSRPLEPANSPLAAGGNDAKPRGYDDTTASPMASPGYDTTTAGERAAAATDRAVDRAGDAIDRTGDSLDRAGERAAAATERTVDKTGRAIDRIGDDDDDDDINEHAADNTGKNERDRDPGRLTAGDQKDNETDLTITQKIRQQVVGEDALSMTAKNVKIITVDGVVTLRGPVKSDGEKRQVASIAQRVTGVKRVDNQLEVASK